MVMPAGISNINTNVAAINVRRHMNINNGDVGKRLERLSSGLRINGADDDASGLVVSEGFSSQITGLTVGVRNAEMGANLLQVAEGSLNEVSAMLIRGRELAVQSSNSTMNDRNREAVEAELNQIKQEIDRIAHSSVYNGQTLLTGFGIRADEANSTAITASATTGILRTNVSGSASGVYTIADSSSEATISLGNGVVSQTIAVGTILDQNLAVATGTTSVLNFDRLGIQITVAGHNVGNATGSYVAGELDGLTIEVIGTTGGSFQVGADNVFEDRIEVGIDDMRASGTFLNLNVISLSSLASSRTAITQLGQAIEKVAFQRGHIGAAMNRLQHTVNFTENSIENNTNSEGTIRDADMAVEITAFTRGQILSQAATSMLTNANAQPQAALSLLQ